MSQSLAEFALSILAAGGSGAVITFAIMRAFGKSWLDAKFAENLERSRSENAKEFERFRSDLDGVAKARSRYDEQQLRGIEEIWISLKRAQSDLASAASPIQYFPNIQWISDEERAAVFDSLKLRGWEISKITSSEDVQNELIELVSRKRQVQAQASFAELEHTARRFELFFAADEFLLISRTLDAMFDVLDKNRLLRERGIDPKLHAELDAAQEHHKAISDNLTALFRSKWKV